MNKIKLSLFDTQVELIEKALLVYLDTLYQKYNYRKVAKTKAENLELSLARDTYCEINLIYKGTQMETVNSSKIQKIS